jgi:hypothetical protein
MVCTCFIVRDELTGCRLVLVVLDLKSDRAIAYFVLVRSDNGSNSTWFHRRHSHARHFVRLLYHWSFDKVAQRRVRESVARTRQFLRFNSYWQNSEQILERPRSGTRED